MVSICREDESKWHTFACVCSIFCWCETEIYKYVTRVGLCHTEANIIRLCVCVCFEKRFFIDLFFLKSWLSNCVRGSMLWQNVSLLVFFWFTTVWSPIMQTQVTEATLKYHQFYLRIHNCCPGISSALSIFITCSREIFFPGCVSVSADVSQHEQEHSSLSQFLLSRVKPHPLPHTHALAVKSCNISNIVPKA